jgi:hypothetical protein
LTQTDLDLGAAAPDNAAADVGFAGEEFTQEALCPEVAAFAEASFCAKYPAPHACAGDATPHQCPLFTGDFARHLTPAAALLPQPPLEHVCNDDSFTHGPWIVHALDDSFYHVENFQPSLTKPQNAECTSCGAKASYMDVLKSWALANLSTVARAEFEAGNPNFQGVPLDPTGMAFNSATAQSSRPQRETMAALTLLGIEFLEHSHTHKPKCFKTAKKKKGKRCRYNLPALLQDGARAFVTFARTNSVVSVVDLFSIDVVVDRPVGFEFTTEHNTAVLFTFRCNTHTKIIAGSPNLIFYCTTYASKCPEGQLGQAAVLKQSLTRARNRQDEADVNVPKAKSGASTYCTILNAATGHCVEAGVTTCAMLLLHDDLGTMFQYSHKFVNLMVSQALDFVNGRPFEVTPVLVDDLEANLAAAEQEDALADAAMDFPRSATQPTTTVPRPTPPDDLGIDNGGPADTDEPGFPDVDNGGPADGPNQPEPATPAPLMKRIRAVPDVLNYQWRSIALAGISYYDFTSWYMVKKGPIETDIHGSKYALLPEHVQHETHHLARRKHAVVPNLIGARIANRQCFNDAECDKLEKYCCYALTM